MRRRQFIGLLGATAVGSAVARAQQQVRRIGILMNLAADDPEGQARVAAFLQGGRVAFNWWRLPEGGSPMFRHETAGRPLPPDEPAPRQIIDRDF